MSKRRQIRLAVPKSAAQKEVEAIDRAFERVSKTPQSAISFLKRAGIVNGQGRLTKAYR